MKLTEFMAKAKKTAEAAGVDANKVSVYAFAEFDNLFYVCQVVIDDQPLRAPIMHSPETAVAVFADAIKHYQENQAKSSADIEI